MSIRFVRLSLICWLPWLAAAALAEPGPVIEDARLWVSQPGPSALLRPEQPSFALALADSVGARAVAVDGDRQLAWFRTDDELAAFDKDGGLVMTFRLDRRGTGSWLAVVPSDGSLWLAEGTSLRAVGAGGQLLHDVELGAEAAAVALDAESELLWVATGEALTCRTAITGVEPLDGFSGVAGVAPLAGTESVWLAHAGGIDTFSTQPGPPLRVPLSAGAAHIAAAAEGEVVAGFWVASGSEILFLDPASGAETWSRPAFGSENVAAITSLAVDPATLSAWVSDGRRLVEVTASFRTVEHYDLGAQSAVRDLAVLRPFHEAAPPTIEILRPFAGETVTGTRRPRIELRVSSGEFPAEPGSLRLAVSPGFTHSLPANSGWSMSIPVSMTATTTSSDPLVKSSQASGKTRSTSDGCSRYHCAPLTACGSFGSNVPVSLAAE